jgi:hypothetical protein
MTGAGTATGSTFWTTGGAISFDVTGAGTGAAATTSVWLLLRTFHHCQKNHPAAAKATTTIPTSTTDIPEPLL